MYFFGDISYEKYFIIGVFSLPILILTSLSFALLKAFKGLKHIANSNIITLLVSFILFIPLVYYFGIMGAVISIVITYLLRLFTNTYYSRKHVLKPRDITYGDIARGQIRKDNLQELFVFAGVGLTIGLLQIGSEIVCRSIVVSQIGIDQLGIYAPNVAWGGLFTGFILPSLYTYLYPRFSEAKSNREISGVLNDVLRMISFMMIPFLFGGIGFRFVLIPMFYSGEFIEAATYLPGHFFGIFFFMIMEAFSQVFAPTGKIKVIGILKGIMFILNVAIVYYFVTNYGLVGWMLKFLITPVFFTFIFFLYIRKHYEFKIEARNVILTLFVLIGGGGLYLLSNWQPLYGLILSVVLIPVSLLFSTKNERKQVSKAFIKFKNKLSRKK
jgi:O-antigen/teichoic acid export membrane protein